MRSRSAMTISGRGTISGFDSEVERRSKVKLRGGRMPAPVTIGGRDDVLETHIRPQTTFMGTIAQGRSDQMSTLRVADMDQASNRTLHGRKSEEEIMSDAELVFTCADLSRDLMMPVHEVRKILRRLKVPSSSQYLIVNCGYSV